MLREDEEHDHFTPTPEELEYLKECRAQGNSPDTKPQRVSKSRFDMPSSIFTIPTLKGASNWDCWYQTLYGGCQIGGIHHVLTGKMTPSKNDEDTMDWEAANSWIEGHIRASLGSGGHSHIAGVKGAFNMIKALGGAYKPRGSREALWRTIGRASLADYRGVAEYVEAIKEARTKLADLGYQHSWEITTSFRHGLPSSYESFVEIVLNSREQDFNGRLMEPDFDHIVEQLLARERRHKLTNFTGNTVRTSQHVASVETCTARDGFSSTRT